MSKWVGTEWVYCDLYLGGLFQAVRAWEDRAVVWLQSVLQTDRYGPEESAAEMDCGKWLHRSFAIAKRSVPCKL